MRPRLGGHGWQLAGLLLAAAALAWLLLYKLGSLTGGLSAGEVNAGLAPVGWHGIYHQPLYLPLKLVRSVVFALFPQHGQTLTRLPNAVLGGLAIISFAWLVRLWHSSRTAVLAGVLFATSAWVLHVSRLASYDVLYLCALPALLLTGSLLQRSGQRAAVWYGSLAVWGLLIYIPGLVWLVALSVYQQRRALRQGWQHFGRWEQRAAYALLGLVWLPLLVVDLARPGALVNWLGLPHRWPAAGTVVKHFVAVPVHLFIRGPEYPAVWLSRAPLLDIFSLAVCPIGIYFYVTHLRAGRSRSLGLFAVIGGVLVGLGGPVGLSLLVPLLYVGVAAGIAYLLHEWMHIFPNNPLARSLGLGLVTLAVALSCLYNLRAYFVAWPHYQTTPQTFNYRR